MDIEGVWYGDRPLDRLARAALGPPSWLFGLIARARGALYDRGVIRSVASGIPVISVGNISVGGTGKTPIAAEIVRRLLDRGVRAAVVMRGYGGDEITLHGRLNRNVRVFANADRVAGIRDAIGAGIGAVVLDDAFQHRRARRDADIVLVSAERWKGGSRMLPAGPLREPASALLRATLVVVTMKSAPEAAARRVAAELGDLIGSNRVAIVRLRPEALVPWATGATVPLAALEGASILAISGIGEPAAFEQSLSSLGAVVTAARFRDHHPFTKVDAANLARAAAGHKFAVCTEKDAVKLGPLWPSQAGGLWYVSQAVEVVDGEPLIDAAIDLALSRSTKMNHSRR